MTNMNVLIRDFCDEFGYEFYDGYSGRCMYGRRCPGIVCNGPMDVLIEMIEYIMDVEDDCTVGEIHDVIGSPRLDNMGMDMIMYFPRVKSDEVTEDCDED